MRQERNQDQQYLNALQQRSLDPASVKRIKFLRQAVQTLEQGLNDVDAVLDAQWEEHLQKEKKTRSLQFGMCQ